MTTVQRTQVEGMEVGVVPEAAVASYPLKMTPPSLSDLEADADRLLEALRSQHQVVCHRLDFAVLRELSPALRSWDWKCQASVRGDEIVALAPEMQSQLGLAVDLGTTKIAGYLVDLSSGETLRAGAIMNPQIGYGEDVVTRLSQAISVPDKAYKLREVAVSGLNQLVLELCTPVGVREGMILEAVVVGNTAMHHLLLELPVGQLAGAPYVPAVRTALDIKARDIGLNVASGAYVHLLPNIAGYVGSDHTAALLASEVLQINKVTVLLDIGTNTEISLINDGKITSVSCASGPAFEGGHIKCGMRAASGAIERLRLENDTVQYQTIYGAPPVGICGSGILDAMSELYLGGVLNKNGRMLDGHCRVRTSDGQREFVLVSEVEGSGQIPIVITQRDVRELQLAKAAIRTGIQVLLESEGLAEEAIEQVIIAGAFGSYIDIASAITIGLLPTLPLERFHQVGNAAGIGAKMALVSTRKRAEAQQIASKVHYVELATAPVFTAAFIATSYIGQYRIIQGKREEIK